LVTTKFKKSITRGFAADGEPHVAVCLLPGTEIVFDENVDATSREDHRSPRAGPAVPHLQWGRGRQNMRAWK
jgi:hypothetical protein